jgi:hypothetical protein
MINGPLRPWGKPHWLFGMPSLKEESWFLIGVLSTQDRCLSTVKHRGASFDVTRAAFLEIIDEQSKFSTLTETRRNGCRGLLEAAFPTAELEIHEFSLFEPFKKLKKLVETWVSNPPAKNVILDASAMPEKFLFPIVRWLLDSSNIRNIVVTYMLPERYTEEDLGYDARDAGQFHTFTYDGPQPEPAIQNVIVGVGFLPFSLPEWLKKTYKDANKVKVSLILPFPSAPSNVQKGWEFIRRVEGTVRLVDDRQIPRVDAHDMSACFDRIQMITNFGKSATVFAPFGPKVHSVAMCLQAIKMKAEVYYTQPSFYHPEYSTGIELDGTLPAGFAYAIRLGGCDLY